MLFTLGGAFSIREGVHKLLGSGPHVASIWAFVVLGGAFVFESLSITVAIRALKRARGDTSMRTYWRRSRDPTLLTVVLEDSSALLSIGVAAGGLGLSIHTGDPAWDALASAMIGVVLIGVALVLALENYSLLLGEIRAPRRPRPDRGDGDRRCRGGGGGGAAHDASGAHLVARGPRDRFPGRPLGARARTRQRPAASGRRRGRG